MLAKIKQVKNWAILACFVLTVFLMAIAFSQYLAYMKVKNESAHKQGELIALNKDINEVKNAIGRFKQEQEEFSNLLFKERDIPAFLDELSRFAKMATISIVDIKTKNFEEVKPVAQGSKLEMAPVSSKKVVSKNSLTQDPKSLSTLAALQVDIKIAGNFTSLVRFLDQVQNYKQLVSISNIEIRTAGQYPKLDCQFTLRIYSLKKLAELKA